MEENNYNYEEQNTVPAQSSNRGLYLTISALLIMVLLLMFSVLTFIGKDKLYSDTENRYLQSKPAFSISAVSDGRYMEEMEEYLSDQFAARGALVRARTVIDVMLGRKEVNDVYLGKSRFLFEKPSAFNEETVNASVAAINGFAAAHSELTSYAAIAPNASELLSDLMPKNAPTENQTEQIEKVYSGLRDNVKTVDLCSELKKSENRKELYYRTDHHWTTEAARIAFQSIAAEMGLDTSGVDYDSYAVTDSFQGTLASSSGLQNAKDSIYITVPSESPDYVVTYVDENVKTASMFDSSKLGEKNKYEVFFGGNYGQVKIDTDVDTDKVLMVVKDSYANCLIPMLTPYYRTIIVIDPRYYTGDIERTVKKEAVTDVLWLYNANTFLKDTSIAEVFGSDYEA